uniref:Uncharacterized protein n=1 Tax=Kwoniella dejecticola CBS 10117 TaxID=1296121 RepID=A0A1A5ZYV8_9TREE|nr:uncharacterized protein I303_06538 [Kwoniella dejecticola CBS 10117]OBR82980.1 hypothetical protein I303_06538 [Kwoniella dejecticola CBS 10117]
MTDKNYDNCCVRYFEDLPEDDDILHLRVLDCFIEIRRYPCIDYDLAIRNKPHKKTRYDEVRLRPASASIVRKEEDPFMVEAAARLIAEAAPNIEKGFLWLYGGSDLVFTDDTWDRWTWTCNRTADQVEIAVNTQVEEFSHKWIDNADGQDSDRESV